MRTRWRPPPSMAASCPVKRTMVASPTPLDRRRRVRRKESPRASEAARPKAPSPVVGRMASTRRPCSRNRRMRSPAFSACARPRESAPALSATSYSNRGIVLLLVRHDRQDLLDRRVPLDGPAETRLTERHHAALDGVAAKGVAVGAVEHHAPDGGIEPEHLVERHAARVPHVAAGLAALPAVEHLGDRV